MAIRKKWRIRCECGHEFYVPWKEETFAEKVKGFFGKSAMCTACGSKKTKVIELIEKKKRE